MKNITDFSLRNRRAVRGRSSFPLRVSGAPRSRGDCLRSPEKREKVTSVMQATSISDDSRKGHSLSNLGNFLKRSVSMGSS